VYSALTAEPPVTAALIAASFRSQHAADALAAFWSDRYARAAVIVHRAIDRGEIPARTDARRLLTAATAPLYPELVLLRTPAHRSAEATAVAAQAGAFAG